MRPLHDAVPQLHGSASALDHDGLGLYRDVAQGIGVGRYHSLVVDPATLPDELVATAHTDGGVLMGIRHEAGLVEGVQFHPESILTPDGDSLLANFLADAAAFRGIQPPVPLSLEAA